MSLFYKKISGIVLALLVPLTFLAAGCSLFGSMSGGSGEMWTYKMPENQNFNYSMTNNMEQELQMMGQNIDINSDMTMLFTVQPKGMKDENYNLGVTVDTLSLNVSSPQGDFSPDLSSIIGKSFGIVLSKLGEEIELNGADSLKYSMGASGETSISSSFQMLFPKLPHKTVNIGDTWVENDTMNVNQGKSHLMFVYQKVDTLKGFEEVDGVRCAKVNSSVTGTLSGSGKQMNMNLSFEGKITGNDTWFFSPEKGSLVKMEVNRNIDASIAGTGAQEINIPMTMIITNKLNLQK